MYRVYDYDSAVHQYHGVRVVPVDDAVCKEREGVFVRLRATARMLYYCCRDNDRTETIRLRSITAVVL